MSARRETTAHGEDIYSRAINRIVNGRPIERYHGRVFVPEPARLKRALKYWGVKAKNGRRNRR